MLINSQGEQAVITGDMMHHPIQVAMPEHHATFDMDKPAGAKTRVEFVNRVPGASRCWSSAVILPIRAPATSCATARAWKLQETRLRVNAMGKQIPDYPSICSVMSRCATPARSMTRLREFSPVVRLADGTVMITRHADVTVGLQDWQTFSNKSRPWHDPNSLRPEILLTDDPPRHTHVRQAMAKVLSTQALANLRPSLERDAHVAVRRSDDPHRAKTLDAVREITQRFVYKALPDAIGLRVEGREHMYAFSHMVWATMGPENELFREAMVNIEPVLEWLEQCCDRDNLVGGRHRHGAVRHGR